MLLTILLLVLSSLLFLIQSLVSEQHTIPIQDSPSSCLDFHRFCLFVVVVFDQSVSSATHHSHLAFPLSSSTDFQIIFYFFFLSILWNQSLLLEQCAHLAYWLPTFTFGRAYFLFSDLKKKKLLSIWTSLFYKQHHTMPRLGNFMSGQMFSSSFLDSSEPDCYY